MNKSVLGVFDFYLARKNQRGDEETLFFGRKRGTRKPIFFDFLTLFKEERRGEEGGNESSSLLSSKNNLKWGGNEEAFFG